MTIDKDEAVILVPADSYERLSVETRHALSAYSTRPAWRSKGGICFVVADYRVDELSELAGFVSTVEVR